VAQYIGFTGTSASIKLADGTEIRPCTASCIYATKPPMFSYFGANRQKFNFLLQDKCNSTVIWNNNNVTTAKLHFAFTSYNVTIDQAS
jgi:hypothetical protein